MGDLLTAENLPIIIGLVLAPHVINWVRDVIAAFTTWRKGATDKEKNILLDTLAQLERCGHERDKATDERDQYRRAVGRRDYLLLAHGIELPSDNGTKVSTDESADRSSGPATT